MRLYDSTYTYCPVVHTSTQKDDTYSRDSASLPMVVDCQRQSKNKIALPIQLWKQDGNQPV